MDRLLAARIFSVLLLGAAAATWIVFDEHAAAIGLAAMAVAAWLTMSTPDVPSELAARLATSHSETLARVVQDLRLEGRGVHVPCADGRVRLFIPASPRTDKPIPPLVAEGIVAEGAAAVGLALVPPGQALYDAWVTREGKGPKGRGVEEAADQVRRALPALGVGTRVKVSRAPGRLRIEYVPTWTREACAAGRADGSADSVGCATCSLIAVLVAQALQATVRYAGTTEEGGAVVVDIEDARVHAAVPAPTAQGVRA